MASSWLHILHFVMMKTDSSQSSRRETTTAARANCSFVAFAIAREQDWFRARAYFIALISNESTAASQAYSQLSILQQLACICALAFCPIYVLTASWLRSLTWRLELHFCFPTLECAAAVNALSRVGFCHVLAVDPIKSKLTHMVGERCFHLKMSRCFAANLS